MSSRSSSQIESEIREIMSDVASGDLVESEERRPVELKPMRISEIDPATMTAGAINKELDKLDERGSVLGRMMIDAGRGHERTSEYLERSDPLSSELRRVSDRRRKLSVEISMRYGPGADRISRLPTGNRDRKFFGPRRKKGE